MSRYRKLFLLASLAILLHGCRSGYSALKPQAPDSTCIQKLKPVATTAWYHAGVDVGGKHLSGLLLIKNMPDSARRVVFTSEAGLTFFDFEFRDGDRFLVHTIIHKMDRKPVVSTLRKDFALLLGEPFRNKTISAWRSGNEVYFGTVKNKEASYFIADANCANLQRLEMGSRRKRKVTIDFDGKDTVNVVHHTFPMKIQLLRLKKNDADR